MATAAPVALGLDNRIEAAEREFQAANRAADSLRRSAVELPSAQAMASPVVGLGVTDMPSPAELHAGVRSPAGTLARLRTGGYGRAELGKPADCSCRGWRLHLVDPREPDAIVRALVTTTKSDRHESLRQSSYTNQFVGSSSVEMAYHQYTTELQASKVQRRLLLCAAAIFYEVVFLEIAEPYKHVSALIKASHAWLPCCLLLGASAALHTRVVRRFWRPLVMASALTTFLLVITSLRPLDEAIGELNCSQFVLYELVWLLLYVIMVLLNSALDFVHTALTCVALYAEFLAVLLAEVHALWRREPSLPCGRACRHDPILKSLAISLIAVVLMLYGARRVNRFERLAFVQAFRTQLELEEKRSMIAGGRIELLGIFSNPTLSRRQQRELGLMPLKLGQELKFLVRSVPRVHLEIVPAATFSDAKESVLRFSPRIIMFSGHTLSPGYGVSALAFESDNSRVDVSSSADHFIAMLREASAAPAAKLMCVFLNACLTLDLGLAILREPALAHLKVICWATITEDSAARYFSSGFADSIGADLGAAEAHATRAPNIAKAFEKGCEVFRDVGCRFGDPQEYLDAGEMAPPVQGDVLLLTCAAGRIIFGWRSVEGEGLVAEVLEERTASSLPELSIDGLSRSTVGCSDGSLGAAQRQNSQSGWQKRALSGVSATGSAVTAAASPPPRALEGEAAGMRSNSVSTYVTTNSTRRPSEVTSTNSTRHPSQATLDNSSNSYIGGGPVSSAAASTPAR